MSNIIEIISKRIAELEQYKAVISKRMEKLKYKGNQKYHIKIDSKRNQLYVRSKSDRSKGKYVKTKNLSNAKQIATYDYLTHTLKLIDDELKQLDRTLKALSKDSPEEYYKKLSTARQKLIVPIRLTDEQFVEQWLAEPFEAGVFDSSEVEYYTNKNERVRSKSEIMIANALERHNVPYKYECPLYLDGLGLIHPDFTTLNVKRRKIYYWEHLGKMDDTDYSRKNVYRINTYIKNGIMPGENLILTMETSTLPLDSRIIDRFIEQFLK